MTDTLTTNPVATFYKEGHDLAEAEEVIKEHGLEATTRTNGCGMAVYDDKGTITYSSGMYVTVDVFNERDAVIFRMFADDFVEGPSPIQKLGKPRVRFGLW